MSRVATGLPSNPRSRLARPAAPQSASRQLDEQRSLRSIPSTRIRHAPVHREQVPDTQTTKAYQPRHRNNYHEARDARLSGISSSTSSSEASFWARGRSSQRSSRTTLPSHDNTEYTEIGREDEHLQSNIDNSQDDSSSRSFANFKDTGLVWSRVTEVASVWTQEVSKAWATGLTPLSNAMDDDPEGESHLTRVMRAYHLSKARTPADLPDWLFSDRERGQGGLLRSDPHDDGRQARGHPAAQPKEPRNRRDIHQVDRPTPSDLWSKHTRSHTPETKNPAPQPKPVGSDRLKMMRDLRRNASNPRALNNGGRI